MDKRTFFLPLPNKLGSSGKVDFEDLRVFFWYEGGKACWLKLIVAVVTSWEVKRLFATCHLCFSLAYGRKQNVVFLAKTRCRLSVKFCCYLWLHSIHPESSASRLHWLHQSTLDILLTVWWLSLLLYKSSYIFLVCLFEF